MKIKKAYINKVRAKEKIFLFSFLMIFFLSINTNVFYVKSESSPTDIPRVVLVELFVQAECSTCPIAEFCLEDLAWEYGPQKLILVEEHLWGDGYDTEETNARYNWYIGEGKKGTPDVFINGLTKRIQGLACECGDIDENYLCYKKAVDIELVRPSLVELSATKTISDSAIIIKGEVKNISELPLKDLAVCGMIYRERDETGLYCCVQDIFPFKNISLLSPEETYDYYFISEPFALEDGEENKFHVVVFVQELKTKEVLQALYVE